MSGIEWQCPHCNNFVVITKERSTSSNHFLSIENDVGKIAVRSQMYVCPNPSCRKPTSWVSMWDWDWDSSQTLKKKLKEWRLYPEGGAKPFPDYIPIAIRTDYVEACLIAGDSPKASATLSRRCLQGIIRDFWGVKPGRLVDEIDQIKEKTDPITWGAIDAVRKLGNIGAHMERDINLIVDVDPNEANLMISLVETLLSEWYVAKHEREARMKAVIAAAGSKKPDKKE